MAARQNAYNGRSEFGSLFERGFELCLKGSERLEIAKVVGTVRLEERGRREISGDGRISHSPHGLKAENLFCVWLFYRFRHFQGTVCLQRFVRSTVFDNCIMKNSFNEDKCQAQIDALYECCNAFYQERGDQASTVSCPKANLLRLKMKQRAQAAKQ
ncbi:hypothetical protein N7524_001634 [Penicillium chrysogenum]|nr:hypothetical protein N7524_001634 [Penicillium chrysogenum]